jgi:hypothetical protein
LYVFPCVIFPLCPALQVRQWAAWVERTEQELALEAGGRAGREGGAEPWVPHPPVLPIPDNDWVGETWGLYFSDIDLDEIQVTDGASRVPVGAGPGHSGLGDHCAGSVMVRSVILRRSRSRLTIRSFFLVPQEETEPYLTQHRPSGPEPDSRADRATPPPALLCPAPEPTPPPPSPPPPPPLVVRPRTPTPPPPPPPPAMKIGKCTFCDFVSAQQDMMDHMKQSHKAFL